jgi:hypothetical protein
LELLGIGGDIELDQLRPVERLGGRRIDRPEHLGWLDGERLAIRPNAAPHASKVVVEDRFRKC